MRGNRLEQAAKCIVIMAKLGRKTTKYILGVVAEDARVNLNAVKSLLGGTYISFASPEIAEKLSGSVVGTVLPFSFTPELELIVDPGLLVHEEIFLMQRAWIGPWPCAPAIIWRSLNLASKKSPPPSE